MASLDEAIAVARATGRRLQVSHLKVAGRPNWGGMPAALQKLDDARADGLVVTHDVYPYTAGSTMLTATLPPWFQDGGDAEVLRRLEDPACLTRLAADLERDDGTWENQVLGAGWEGIVVASSSSHTHDGKDIATIASDLDVAPLDALVEVLSAESLQVSMVVHSMQEPDLELAMQHPATMIGSDGLPPGTGGKPHPRGQGTFPRVLGRYVRERGTLDLDTAVHKMTGLPARTFGLHDRGVVAEGNIADLVVLDADVVVDGATYAEPTTPPEGIVLVMQAGQVVVRDGTYQQVRAGRRLTPRR
jgi:N-acyl-D-aspartate/D-glutamate deacylase